MGARGRAIFSGSRTADLSHTAKTKATKSAHIWHMSVLLLLEYDASNVSGLEGVQCGRHTSLHTVVTTVQRNGGTR